MSDAKSNYLERKVLDHVLGTASMTVTAQCYIALFTSLPSDTSSGAEVVGGSYARQAIDFNPATTDVDGVTIASNSNIPTFTNMPTCTVTHFAIFDALTAGNMLYHGELTSSKSFTAGDDMPVPVGAIMVREQ